MLLSVIERIDQISGFVNNTLALDHRLRALIIELHRADRHAAFVPCHHQAATAGAGEALELQHRDGQVPTKYVAVGIFS